MIVKGYDGKGFNSGDFTANLAVEVTIEEFEQYKQDYNDLMEEIFDNLAFPRERTLYKGSELKNLYYEHDQPILERVATRLSELVDEITLSYQYHQDEEDGSPKTIYCYEDDEEYTPPQFVREVRNEIPIISCYVEHDLDSNNQEDAIYIDHCSDIKPSPAVREVIDWPKTSICFSGDETNYAINAADVLVKYIAEKCKSRNWFLNSALSNKLSLDSIQTRMIGNGWLHSIVPEQTKPMRYRHRYTHPLFVLLKGDENFKGTATMLRKTPVYGSLKDRAASENGSVKLFDENDVDFLRSSDYLVYHDKVSEKQADSLLKLTHAGQKINAEDLM